jgi:hypothetical protein
MRSLHKAHKINIQCAKKVPFSVEKFQFETNNTLYYSGLIHVLYFQSVSVKFDFHMNPRSNNLNALSFCISHIST